MDVIKRLLKILELESVTASRFADTIGINRAAMSHYLNGRNNPSLDVLNKILDAYPKINPLWLLRGSGTMLLTDIDDRNVNIDKRSPAIDLFTSVSNAEILEESSPQLGINNSELDSNVNEEDEENIENENATYATSTHPASTPLSPTSTSSSSPPEVLSSELLLELNKSGERSVKKIILMYSDSTFAVFEQSNTI